MKQSQKSRLTLLALLMILVLPFLLFSCKELGNEAPDEPTLILDVRDIKRQIGLAPAENVAFSTINAPSDIVTIALGALDISQHPSGFYYDPNASDFIGDDIADDVTASYTAGYIKFITREDFQDKEYVEFSYPQSGQSKWQVLAVAFTAEITTLDEAADAFDNGSVKYGGATSTVYTADDIDDTTVISLTMVTVN